MSVSQSSELNYTASVAQHSMPRKSLVLPLGSDYVTLDSGSTREFQFELPNKVYNLHNSTLDFKMSIADTSGLIHRVHTLGQAAINSISIYTREGTYLCDMPNFDKFSRAVTPYVTKLDDLQQHAHSRGAATQAAADTQSKGYNSFKSNALASATPGVALGANSTRISAAGAVEAPEDSITGLTHFVQGTVGNGAGAGDVYFNYSIPLSEIHHSLCSVDRVMYFGQSLMCRVRFNSTKELGFDGSSATVLSDDLAPLTAAVNVTKVRIYLAVETNRRITEGLVQRVQSQGLQVIMPYTYAYKYSSTASTNSSVQQRLNAGFGQRLLHAVHANFNPISTNGDLTKDISNKGDVKMVSYQTQLDNENLQEFVPLCAQSEDYELHRQLLDGSCVQSVDAYKANHIIVDSWRKGRMCDWKSMDGNEIDGLELTSERIWNINMTTPSVALDQYSWFVVQRTLSINPSGIISVS